VHQPLRNFYIITIAVIFGIAMIIQIPALKVNNHLKMIVFVAWAAYGIIPTLHWYLEMGGTESQMVKVSRHQMLHCDVSSFLSKRVRRQLGW
jgi:predicted membrane channel-forming protein YqfA (hemolysin III family)